MIKPQKKPAVSGADDEAENLAKKYDGDPDNDDEK
jgi:hypothetical protein